MKQRTPGYIFIPIVLIALIVALMMVTPTNFEPQEGFLGFFSNLFKHFIGVFSNGIAIGIFVITLVMTLIIHAINKAVESQKFKKLSTAEQEEYLERSKVSYFKRLITSGHQKQTDEEEEAIIIDHGFDGIQELDNSLPQWWLAMFYMGVVFMVVYVLAYSFTDFAHPIVEYEEDVEYSEKKIEEWIKNNDITIDGAVNKFQDEAAIAEGKKYFELVCATCHSKNGGGGIGPNLTDDYWINHNQDSLFYNIYDVVYNGSPNNPTMRAFGQRKEFTGLTIEKIASYVYYINNVTPDVTEAEGGAKPQGDFMPAWAQNKKEGVTNDTTPAIEETKNSVQAVKPSE